MHELTNVSGVAHVIQLSVAPVFLLTGVGAILSVLVNRLGRVVDRFRALERHERSDDAAPEMDRLSRRARLIHWAIGLATSCALFVCMVVASRFISSITGVELSTAIAVLFIAAMLALVSALLCFLREITLAKSSIHRLPPKQSSES
ncbi:MAG TPA: DUF2721 domain-containing protein [Rhodocyclaceae bacterium]